MPKKSTINLISFILLAVFLIMGMFLVTVGVGAYRSVNARAGFADEARMSLGYITNKLRAYDAEGEISIEDRNGLNTIVLTRPSYEGYETLIYFYNGTLYEMFRDMEYEIEPEFGQALVEMKDLSFCKGTDGSIEISATLSDGQKESTVVMLRSMKGAIQ